MIIYGVWQGGGGRSDVLHKLFLREEEAKAYCWKRANDRIDQEPLGVAPFDPSAFDVTPRPYTDRIFEVHALELVFFIKEHELQCSALDLLARQSE
jgi:hypothetical protein